MEVRRPEWWPYPERCENGHEWGPGRVLGVVGAVSVPRRPDAAPDRAIWGHVTVRLPGAGVPVGVVVAAARRGHRFTGWRCASFPAQAPVLLLCLARRLGAPLRAF